MRRLFEAGRERWLLFCEYFQIHNLVVGILRSVGVKSILIVTFVPTKQGWNLKRQTKVFFSQKSADLFWIELQTKKYHLLEHLKIQLEFI